MPIDSPQELAFAASAIDTYKKRILPAVQFGDLYRLENPHTNPRSAMDYIIADRASAIIFEPRQPIVSHGATPGPSPNNKCIKYRDSEQYLRLVSTCSMRQPTNFFKACRS
jgi:hypothetical protein